MKDAKEFIIEYLEREYELPKDIDYDTFNFVETGYVDSMGIIQFIVLIEDEFGISFSDEELDDPSFKTINGLTKLIENKVAENM